MKKLLFFIESLSGGGAEKALVTLLHHLNDAKYDITLLTLVDAGPLRADVNLKRIHYQTVIRNSSNTLHSLWNKTKYKLIYHLLPIQWACKLVIPQKDFDLYIAFTEGFATKLLAHAPGKKIAWIHTDLNNNPWPLNIGIYKDLEEEKFAYGCYDKAVCVSRVVEEVMNRYYGIHQTQTIYNLIDADYIIAQSIRPSSFSASQGFNIVTVGRLVVQKGYDRLIPIIAKLSQEGNNINLLIIGAGPELANLKQIAHRCRVADSISFMGYQNNPYPIMLQADLLVCSSRVEGFGLTIAEAMILGLPVISMRCSGPEELLQGGKYGELCDDYISLAHAIGRACSDADYLQGLRKKSLAGQTCFNVKQPLQQIETLFDSI